jgi:membrane-associated phospholipid phosphatase
VSNSNTALPGAPRASGHLALAGVLLFFTALLIAGLVTQVGAPPFDRWLTVHLDSWRRGFGGTVFRTASRVGYGTWLIPATLVVALLAAALRRLVAPVVLVLVASPVTSLVNAALKDLFDRPRPMLHQFEPTGSFSMPSGHSASSACFAVVCILAAAPGPVRRTVAVLGVLFALTVGMSRIVLGVHWTTDVIAGWCEGAGIALLIAALVNAVVPARHVRA